MAKINYTYQDFLESAQKAGLLGGFSDADMRLAQSNPDAGMSILSYKQDYKNASTDEARALANAGAERIRSVYGGYTGGTDGAGYYLNESNGDRKDYVNQYEDAQQDVIDSLSGSFRYDEAADDAWQSYRQAYTREGQRAYEDSLGAAASNTGGVASTAAVTAAQQARNYYAAQAADKKAALRQQAYENWLAGRAQAVSELGVYDELNRTAAANYQQAVDNGMAERQLSAAEGQQSFDNAMEKWKAYGYVTADITGTLALPVGTPYTEQAYNEWYQAYQEAANGVYTGRIQRDTVNDTAQEQERYNPAAGDSPANHGSVSQGSSGGDVQTMQRYLIALGYHCGDKGADGVFGSATRAAVRAFQSDHNLKVDGICGPRTWYALIASLNG